MRAFVTPYGFFLQNFLAVNSLYMLGTHLDNAPSETAAMSLEIIVPVLMSCALLWWVSRGMAWSTRLVVIAVTLVLIIAIVAFERSGIIKIN